VTHQRRIGWPGVLVVLVVLGLGLVGVALAGVKSDKAAANVMVTFTDKRLAVSHGLVEAGPATFFVANKGLKPHTLTIRGPGIGIKTMAAIRAGGNAKITLTLRKGAYMLAEKPIRGSATIRWLMVAPASSVKGDTRNNNPFPDPVPMDCD
jgi:hypothetical protein